MLLSLFRTSFYSTLMPEHSDIHCNHSIGLACTGWSSFFRYNFFTYIVVHLFTSPKQPHVVQTVMAAENALLLAAAIPAFELFVTAWKNMAINPTVIAEGIVPFIRPGLTIAKKYYDLFMETDAYIIAMCKSNLQQFMCNALTLSCV
jgi:hypothetical protein